MTIQDAVNQGSTQVILDAFQRLKAHHVINGRWLGPRNRYAKDTLERVRHDERNPHDIRSSHLAEYLAVSVLLHCSDGWDFFSQAVDGIIQNDRKAIIHMGYYAELRAAMSFLAYSGIGVFNNAHCWIDSAGSGHFFLGQRTHGFVWDALRDWSQVSSNTNKLLRLISVNGHTIADWLGASVSWSPGVTVSLVAKEWLKTWSLDLRLLWDPRIGDRNYRNEVSYRPQGVRDLVNPMGPERALSWLIQFWEACEPSGNDRFSILDRYLLQNALARIFRSRHDAPLNSAAYQRFVDRTFANMGLPNSGTLYNFLRYPSSDDYIILQEAKLQVKTTRSEMRHIPILARALLLLRLSSAAVENMFKVADIDSIDVEFWWRPLGQQNGFWTQNNVPDEMMDLWADVGLAIENIEAWCDQNINEDHLRPALIENGGDLWTLRQFKRVELWAIGL